MFDSQAMPCCRHMVGALLAVGQGKLSLEDIKQRLAAGREQGPGEGATAEIMLLAALVESLGAACRCGGNPCHLLFSIDQHTSLDSSPVISSLVELSCAACRGPCCVLAACRPLLSPGPTGQLGCSALNTAAYVKGDDETKAAVWAACGCWLRRGHGCLLTPAGAAWRGWNTAAPQGLCLMSVQYVPHDNVNILCHPDELVHDSFGRPAIPVSPQSPQSVG